MSLFKKDRCEYEEEIDGKQVRCLRDAVIKVDSACYCEKHMSGADEVTWK